MQYTTKTGTKGGKYYQEGKTEMEWSNPQDRLALVKEFSFRCEYVDLVNCETCSAREYCDAYAGEDEE